MQQRDAKPIPQGILFVRPATPRLSGTLRIGFYSALCVLYHIKFFLS